MKQSGGTSYVSPPIAGGRDRGTSYGWLTVNFFYDQLPVKETGTSA
ncbi:MAG: hypothetical protein H0V18_03995 [Pyrinomonadaceae bacterium]|nr:hypothetical protein [Pyrinomonadaceae bacterium]